MVYRFPIASAGAEHDAHRWIDIDAQRSLIDINVPRWQRHFTPAAGTEIELQIVEVPGGPNGQLRHMEIDSPHLYPCPQLQQAHHSAPMFGRKGHAAHQWGECRLLDAVVHDKIRIGIVMRCVPLFFS